MKQGREYAVAVWGAGVCLVTQSVLQGDSPIRWAFGDEKLIKGDTGWRFSSEDDTDAIRGTLSSWVMVDFNLAIELEPALVDLLAFNEVEAPGPGLIGTEAKLVNLEIVAAADGEKLFKDADTGKFVDVPKFSSLR